MSTPHRVADQFQTKKEGGEVWPGVWTPLTYLSKAAAVHILFPHISITMEFKEETLPPPRVRVLTIDTRLASHSGLVKYINSSKPFNIRHFCRSYIPLSISLEAITAIFSVSLKLF